MARYLVTGGAGFIGSHLSEALLADHHSVCILDNLTTGKRENLPQNAEFIPGDISDHTLLTDIMATVDGCFHLAAIASVVTCNEDWLKAHQINLTNTLKIIDTARGRGKRKPIPVVFASSAAVYGDSNALPLRESGATQPISMYGVNKLCCEYYTRIASEIFQVPCAALRLFNVYGPRQSLSSSYSGIITKFANKLICDEPLTIYGSGEQTRDFIFVTDVVRFFIAAMITSTNSMRIFNVCSGRSTSVKQLAQILSDIFGKKMPINFEPGIVGDITESLGSPDLANYELGIKAEMPLNKGLERLKLSIIS